MHRSLPLDHFAVGALSALPILLLATATVLGSLLIARFGPRRAVLAGLLLLAIGGALRGAGPSLPMLFGMTLVMGVGIAVVQPGLPSLVARWLPRQVGVATAAYSNGFLIGEILPVALTVPFVVSLVGGSWEAALAFWSIPALLAAVAVGLFTAPEQRQAGAARPLWLPDWSNPTTLRLGITMGCASAAYFGMNGFLPDYLRAAHHPELTTVSLTFLNLFQLPASFVIGALANQLLRRVWPFVATGLITLAAAIGFAYLPGIWQAIAVGVIGYASAQAFMLTLALPPLLAEPHDVHRMTAGITTVQYSIAFLVPVVTGAVWDANGTSLTVVLMVAAAAAVQALVPLGLRLEPHPRRMGAADRVAEDRRRR